jgi:transketolase
MRNQFVRTVEKLFEKDKKLFLLLGDIGVYGFRNIFKRFPDRCLNIGVMEQSSVGFAAGLSKTGMIPIYHTIAPFMIERAYEQLKIDFGYQKLKGNFVSVGASYDYLALGPTHQCPADINLLKNIPNFQIIVPGNSFEFDLLFKQTYRNKFPTYFRLSNTENIKSFKVKFGKGYQIKKGKKATLIICGPVLNFVDKIIEKFDINVIYYTTIFPFDKKILEKNIINSDKKIIIIEPFYSGAIINEINNLKKKYSLLISSVSVPLKFIKNYGLKEKMDKKYFNYQKILHLIKKTIDSNN